MTRLLIVVLMASACSTVHDKPVGVTLECHSRTECPTPEDLSTALSLFAGNVDGFDPKASLLIEWWPKDTTFSQRTVDGHTWSKIGFSPSGNYVVVTSFPVLAHELMHVHFWRVDGDGDANHELPPGMWTEESYRIVDDVANLFSEVFE